MLPDLEGVGVGDPVGLDQLVHLAVEAACNGIEGIAGLDHVDLGRRAGLGHRTGVLETGRGRDSGSPAPVDAVAAGVDWSSSDAPGVSVESCLREQPPSKMTNSKTDRTASTRLI